jgi:hypothetical protein
MWLALSSIVLAFSIGFNVLALWLTDTFERDRTDRFQRDPRIPELDSTNENRTSPTQPTGGHGYLPRGAKLLGAM